MADKLYILPFLRKGLSGFINSQSSEKGKNRAEVDLSVKLSGKDHESGLNREVNLDRKIQLVGPSDVKHVNESAIALVYPPSSKSQTFNASYMPFLEFYEEDFPWRYTPLKENADGSLCPWIMLVAVTQDEFTVRTEPTGMKVVTFNLSNERYNQVFPIYSQKTKTNQVCKLAHVQVVMGEKDNVTDETVNELLVNNPDKGISRLLCSSVLPAGESITVFLLPVFESGRLGGLGRSTENVKINEYAVVNRAVEFPVYYQWSFITSKMSGTFSELADKLEMTPDEDYAKLSSNLTVDISNSGILVKNGRRKDENGEIVIDVPAALMLKGEVDSDAQEKLRSEGPNYVNTLREELMKSPMLVSESGKDDEDPWVVPPIYGAHHLQATQNDLAGNGENKIIEEVNLHLKNRIPAGMGSTVVKEHQESFVNRAWQKVEKINELNQIIREYCQMSEVNRVAAQRKMNVDPMFDKQLRVMSSDAILRVLNNSKRFRGDVTVESIKSTIDEVAKGSKKKKKSSQQLRFEENLRLFSSMDKSVTVETITVVPTAVINQLSEFCQKADSFLKDYAKNKYTTMGFSICIDLEHKVPNLPKPIKDKVNDYYSCIGWHKTKDVPVLGKETTMEEKTNSISKIVSATRDYIIQATASNERNKVDAKKKKNGLSENNTLGWLVKLKDKKNLDLLTSIANSTPESVASTKTLSYTSELIENAKKLLASIKSNGDFLQELTNIPKIRKKELSRLHESFLKSVVGFQNAKKIENNEPDIESYSDIMVSKRKRFIGITKSELDKLVDSRTWSDALGSEARIQKLALQRAAEFVASNRWLSGVVEPVYSCKDKKFLFIRPRNQFVPTKNMYFINENCSRLIMAAFGKIKMPFDRKTYGWFAQVAKDAAKSNNDIFSSIYSLENVDSSSKAFYPLQVQVGKSVGYIMDDRLFSEITKKLNLKSNNKPLAITFNAKNDDGSISDHQELVYIIPSSYSDLTYKKEYSFHIDGLLFKDEIRYKYQNGICSNFSGSLINGKDVNTYILKTYLAKLMIPFGVYPSWKEFLADVRTINQIWLRKPTSATVSLTDDKCIKLNASDLIKLDDTKGELYQKLIDKLEDVKIPWKTAKTQSDQIQDKEIVSLEKEAAERIETIINKYKDVENGQLSDWRNFVKSKKVSSKFPVMAYPEYLDPTFFYLRELSDEFILPSSGEMKSNTITILNNNPKFEEAFLLGMNTEMGQELMWREYPTDQRGSYFRKFWDQTTLPNMADLEKEYYDIKKINTWDGSLGDNHMAGKGGMIVFAIKGELMKAYPKTKVYLSSIANNKSIELKYVADISSWLTEDTFLVGFQGVNEKMLVDEKLCLTFQEEMGAVQFSQSGLDIDGCKNSTAFASKALNKPSIFVLPL